MATLEQNIVDAVQSAVDAYGCELWGVEVQRAGRFLTVRLYIDKDGGVSVDDCADVSRQVSAIMDVEDFIADKYNLEVSSPGLDRPLFTLDQYSRYVGQEIVVHLRVSVANRRKWRGTLESVEGDMLTLNADGEVQTFAFGNIQKGHIVYHFDD